MGRLPPRSGPNYTSAARAVKRRRRSPPWRQTLTRTSGCDTVRSPAGRKEVAPMAMVKVGEINIECYVEGSGPPLLMIMGWIGHAGFWGEPFLDPLRQRFRTIRLSNRGTGLSDKPPGDVTIKAMADDAAGLLRELGIPRAHVLGISMGGMIAQELVLNYPQAVQGLVLGCTNCGFARGPQAAPQVMVTLAQSNAATTPRDRVKQFLLAASTPEFVQKQEEGLLDWVMATFMDAPTPLDSIGRQFGAITQF